MGLTLLLKLDTTDYYISIKSTDIKGTKEIRTTTKHSNIERYIYYEHLTQLF